MEPARPQLPKSVTPYFELAPEKSFNRGNTGNHPKNNAVDWFYKKARYADGKRAPVCEFRKLKENMLEAPAQLAFGWPVGHAFDLAALRRIQLIEPFRKMRELAFYTLPTSVCVLQ